MSDAANQTLTAPVGDLTLEAPSPVAAVPTQTAGGMVPIDKAALPALDQKVADYVDSIVALDVHSPAFSAKAGDVRAMGDDDIRAAAETSNRLLSSPVRAMQQGPLNEGSKVAKTLDRPAAHRRGPRPRAGDRGPQASRHDPVRRQAARLLPSLRVGAEPHRRDRQGALRRPGRAAQGQRRARTGEAAPVGDDAAPHPVRLRRRAPRRGAGREDRRRSRSPTPTRPRRCATTCCSTRARSTRTC